MRDGIRLAEEIYIFDIDGCIMPPIISNFDDDDKSREKTVNEILKNGSKIKLYTDFIKYYKKNCIKAESVVFITGRKKSEFGKLTESHLKPLNKIKRYQIIYYPERKPLESDVYFEWKVKKIQEIINMNGKNQDIDYNKRIFFKIFDDMDEYFLMLKKFSEKFRLKAKLFLINEGEGWNSLII